MRPSAAPSGDGVATTNEAKAADTFGMALGYLLGDYKSNNPAWANAAATVSEPQANLTAGQW